VLSKVTIMVAASAACLLKQQTGSMVPFFKQDSKHVARYVPQIFSFHNFRTCTAGMLCGPILGSVISPPPDESMVKSEECRKTKDRLALMQTSLWLRGQAQLVL
jgi:hypothetical protein